MKKIVHKPAAPLYAAAAVWVLYALLFPLYRVGHFVIVLAASAAVYGIARLFCKDVVEEVPEEPKTTGNPELDKMVSEGQGALEEMRRLNDSIQDAAISAQIDRLEQVSGKIFRQVQKDPTQLPQIRKFMSYYLPTILKLLRAYDDMSHQGVQGENITGTMERVRGMMGTIVTAFERQLDSLFGDQAMDISTDITVLDNMMAREGLTGGDAVHQAAQENPVADPQPELDIRNAGDAQTQPPQAEDSVDAGNGITLEL